MKVFFHVSFLIETEKSFRMLATTKMYKQKQKGKYRNKQKEKSDNVLEGVRIDLMAIVAS